ncbi:hypothetical protein R6Q59_001852 [Mikania micrantha]
MSSRVTIGGRGGGHQKLMVRGGEDRVMAAVIRSMDDYWKLVVVTSYGVKRIRKRKCKGRNLEFNLEF